jgi:hypothetical protein
MSEVHRDGDTSLHVHDDGIVELRKPIPHDGVLRYTTDDDPTLTSSRKRSEGGLSINEVCRRYAERSGTDFQVAAAAVLDALETNNGGGGGDR